MESKKDIYSLWIHYTTKNEEEYFRKFISGLVSIWESQLNLDWNCDTSLPDSTTIKPDLGPHLSRLPEELLPAIGKFLYVTKDKIDKDGMSSEELRDAELLVRTLILISRNFNNISSVASADYVHLIISICSSIMLKIINKEMEETLDESISFCIYCCHLLECLYDPFFTWRYFKNTRLLAHGFVKYKLSSAAPLHIEVVPFVFELFEQKISMINSSLAFELLNVLGAVVSGSQDVVTGDCNFETLYNALSGVCPATASLLTNVITDNSATIEIRMTAVKCFIIMIYNLLSIEPHQRQIEISTLLESYRGSLGKVSSTSKKDADEGSRIVFLCSMLNMLSTLVNICNEENKKVVQCIMVQNFILESILEAMEKFEVHDELLHSCFQAVAVIIKSEDFSKERMIRINGYIRMFEKLKLIDNPEMKLLTIFIEMATEETYQDAKAYKLRNSKLISPLLQLIPSLEKTTQEWLCSLIFSISSSNLQCKWKAIKCGTIKAACETLKKYHVLAPETINQLISLIETLASISLNTAELKHIFSLFLVSDNKLCQYYHKLLQVLSNITRSNNLIYCRSYFDIQSNADGISLPEIKKWPGSLFGFTFHCWVSLNKVDESDDTKISLKTSSYRRQIFTILTNAKQGIEMNMNAENNLAIIITTKKEFFVVSLFDFMFEENRWYCLDISYTPGKRPFAQNQISIYIDGIQQLVATVKFSHIPENFTWCRIGAPLDDVSFDVDCSSSNNPPPEVEKSGLIPSFISHVPNYITFPLRNSTNVNPYVKNFPLGMQSTIFGPTIALSGQLGNICLFQEPLTTSYIRLLYESGINGDVFSNTEENSELINLQSKLVFFYSPLACAFDHAVDLYAKFKIDGRTIASVCNVHCLKESINSIGGVSVFLPFFETSDYSSNKCDYFFQQNVSVEDYDEVTDFAVSNFRNISEIQLEENSIAVLLILMKNMLKDPVNQEYFLKRYGFAMLGHLLTGVSIDLMDTSVLVSVCLLSENVINTKNAQYQRVFYQNVLFNYDIWARCNFEVLQGHAQFLHYFIKKDKKFFKKRFGVQFLLDIIKKYLSNDDITNSDATKTVRITIIGIINYYIQKEISVQEMNAIVNYILTNSHDFQIIEMIDMLISHLKNKSCTDQLYLLMYEQHCADLFYALLIKPLFSIELKKSIFRLFMVLLKTDRVYERSKLRLQLQDHTTVGLYPGLIVLLPDSSNLPVDIALMILDQIFLTENSGGFAGALTLLNRLWNAPLEAKLEAARKILAVVYMKPNAPALFAKQTGWQDCICRLLILHRIKRPDSVSTLDVGEEYKLSEERIFKDYESSKNMCMDADLKASGVTALVSDNIHLVASSITSVAEDVSSIVAENILFAANNITSAAENVSMLVNENIQYAADTVSSVAGNVNSLVTDNINFAAGVVGSAYSLITQKTSNIEKAEIPLIEAETKALSLPSGSDDPFTLVNFDEVSLSNRSFLNGSFDDLRSHSSHSKCSPSHASKDSISVKSVQSESNDSDVFADNDEERVIFDVVGQWRGTESEREEDKEQELCNAIVAILFHIMWRGYDAHQKSVWKERGQVMACINMIGLNNALHCSHSELKLKLLVMLLQETVNDLVDTHGKENMLMPFENGAELLRWVYDMLVVDPTWNKSKKIPSKLLDNIVGLIDALMVFRDTPNEETSSLVKISFGILLKNASHTDTEICAIAAAKLHTIIQTRKMSEISEGCYILYLLNEIISSDLKDRNMEHYSFMVPVMKTLLAKLDDLFIDDPVVFDLNVDSGPRFYEKFQELCLNLKWCNFLETKVKPNYEKYKNSLNSDLTETMNIFWAECFEAYKKNLNEKNKLVLESKERFEDVIYKPFLQRIEEEHIRFSNVLSQYRNHRILLKKKWKVQKNYLIGPRRAWKDR